MGDGDGDNGDGVKIMVLLGVCVCVVFFLGIHLKQRLNMADLVGRHLIREDNSPNGDEVQHHRMALW